MKPAMFILFCVALIHIVLADDLEEVQFKLGQPELILNCSVSGAAEVQWFRNGTKLSEKDNVKFSHDDGTHSITITKPKKEDIGSYSCMADGPRAMNKEFRVSMEPVVVKFSTSSNVVEGERFRLPCVVYGYPTPKVEWRRAGDGEDVWENIEANDRFMFENNNEGIEGATMVITEVKMEDRDDYMCFASNELGTANSTILIRVIDKYAALWPFLGICAEVIVLCTIIFIFERRRSKKMQFDEAEEQQNNSKHVGNATKDSEVRNRK